MALTKWLTTYHSFNPAYASDAEHCRECWKVNRHCCCMAGELYDRYRLRSVTVVRQPELRALSQWRYLTDTRLTNLPFSVWLVDGKCTSQIPYWMAAKTTDGIVLRFEHLETDLLNLGFLCPSDIQNNPLPRVNFGSYRDNDFDMIHNNPDIREILEHTLAEEYQHLGYSYGSQFEEATT